MKIGSGWAWLWVASIACAPTAPPANTPDLDPQRSWLPGRVLVRVSPGLEALDVERIAADADAYAMRPSGVPHWWRFDVDPRADVPQLAAEIALASGVSATQPDRRRVPHRTPNDRRFGEQYAHRITHAERGWSVEVGDPSVVVAVIGTGVSMEHQDLSPNIFTNGRELPNDQLDNDLNGFVDDLHGWDFEDGDADPSPVLPPMPTVAQRMIASHETFAAGVVGAVGNNDVGVAGVAWDVSLLPIRFAFTSLSSADAIMYASNLGADVITMSYGSQFGGEDARDPIEEDAVAFAAAAGVVLVASAGNDDTDLLHFPAAYDEVIAVAATDRDDRRAEFSNYGGWIDVTAPGVDVLSTFMGGGYTISDGTSFSGPYVAGLAALLRAAHPTWSRQDIRNTIEFTGEKLFTDHYVGTRVDVGRALDRVTPAAAFARFIDPFSSVRHPGNAPLPLVGTVVGDHYLIEIQPLGLTSWSLLASGSTGVRNGPLATVDTTRLGPGEYRLRLTAIAGNARDVDWLGLTIVQSALPGWPVATDAMVSAPVVVGDLSGDGRPEVIACLSRGSVATLEVFDGRGVLVAGWPRALDVAPTLPPVLGDLDGDGLAEIVVASGGAVLAFRGDGEPSAPLLSNLNALSGLALGDLDGDGLPEVVAAERDGRLWAVTANGVLLPGWPIEVEPGLGAPVVADLDANGRAEIAVVGARRLHIYDGGRRMLLGTPVFVDGDGEAALIGADVDGDGVGELFVGRDQVVSSMGRPWRGVRRVYGLRFDGARLDGWPQELERDEAIVMGRVATMVPLMAADLDGDGRPEVVLASDEGRVHPARADGSSPAGWPANGADWPRPAPTAGDVDGDGRPDPITVSNAGNISAFDTRARLSIGFPLDLGSRAQTPVVLSDLDGDGDVDLVVGGSGGVQAFTTGQRHRPSGAAWALPRHDSAASGYLPAAFPLRARADTANTITLSWDLPLGPMPPVRWRIERDGALLAITTVRSYDDVVDRTRDAHTYRVVGLDVAGNVAVHSRDLRTSATMAWCADSEARACDDGDPCSTNDLCVAGECQGGIAGPDGTACDDANACTTGERCTSGVCQATEVRSCPSNPGTCTAQACDPASGACVERPLGEGTACDDGNACTSQDVCSLGSCRGAQFVSDDVECDDGNLCTRPGLCRAGRCEGAFPYLDGTICASSDICAGSGACINGLCEDVIPLLDGAPCEDDDKCSLGDVCQGGRCASGAARACEDAGACASPSACDPRTGDCRARKLPDYAPCDDRSACTQWDVCVDGRCTGEAPVICAVDGEQCDPLVGVCVGPIEPATPSSCGCSSSDVATTRGGLALTVLGLLWLQRRR